MFECEEFTNATAIRTGDLSKFVLCADCFHYDSELQFCWFIESHVDEDFFCARGLTCL